MESELEQHLLLNEFSSLLEIISRRGLAFDAVSEETFKGLPLNDQRRVVRSLRDLARTPDN